jgi:hypothetical protein
MAQHEHHMMDMGMTDTVKSEPMMTHAFSRSLPMNRNGSGTGWLPDKTPMYAWMKHYSNWSLMYHGAFYVTQNWQNVNNDYRRGGKKFDVPGWVMVMAQRKVGPNGLLLLRAMGSIDPMTVGLNGYPLLLQSGESYKGQPLVDRQHPHDLISELAVAYTQRINPDMDITVYAGLPGEPALGPVAFMHHISAMNNPNAPLGHHWQDATHVTFGVATLGVRYKKFKLEGSSFTGREPDEHRYNFDKPRFDSYSYRLSYAPSSHFTLQASRGFIKSPEDLHPTENVNRTTASVIYSKATDGNDLLTAAAVWGLNQESHHHENSFLGEVNYQRRKTALYLRYEWLQKSAEELNLISATSLFNMQGITAGANYQLGNWLNTNVAVGVQGTVNVLSPDMQALYGALPLSFQAYVRVVPGLFKGM